jgi:DHA3 family macrolide efflux protein-like MFS transporter
MRIALGAPPEGRAMIAGGPSAFRAVWLGQSLSALGAGLTSFALAVWAYERTSSAMTFAAIAACGVLPGLALSPLAGALVDRLELRTALLVGHAGSALGASAIALLLAGDALEVWHLALVTALTSTLGALHWPAFVALTAQLVPAHQLGRASGMTQLGDSAAQLLAPALGGALLGACGLAGVVVVELAGALVALATFALVGLPRRPRAPAPSSGFLRDVLDGGAYLVARPGLLGLFALACIQNAAVSFLEVLSAPIILAVASSGVLGAVRSFAGAGMLAGSLVMSVWGGPRDRVLGVAAFQILFGALLVAMAAATAPWLMALAGFAGLFCIPLINGCGQTLWQTHVDAGFHGRAFALRRLAGLFRPLGFLVAGALADRVLEPLARRGDLRWLGDAPGRGSALLLMMMGAATIAATVLAFRYAPLRRIQRAFPVTP